jgi:predicted acylesterase/phospholipase RssA
MVNAIHAFRARLLHRLSRGTRIGGRTKVSLLLALATVAALVAALITLISVFSGLKARPIDIDCPEYLMMGVERAPIVSPFIAALQRDAGYDPAPWSVATDPPKGTRKAESLQLRPEIDSDPLFTKLVGSSVAGADTADGDKLYYQPNQSSAPNVLLLSGGGAWGAFGAGFLAGLAERGGPNALQNISAITGVSTGAILGLMLAAGNAAIAEAEYTLDAPIGRTRARGLAAIVSLMRRGGLTDLSPLLHRLEAWLLVRDSNGVDRLDRLAANEKLLLIGVVEAASGDFRIFDIGKLAQNTLSCTDNGLAVRRQAARCIAGIALASSAVPIQMVPVRLRNPATGAMKTYVDGGVRLSVFDAHVAEIIGCADVHRTKIARQDKLTDPAPVNLFVLRNGPTVSRPSPADTASEWQTVVDSNPNVLNVLQTSQSAIINQNELTSIAMLRLDLPDSPILVATADGYSVGETGCTELPSREEPYPLAGMRCLARFGRAKAAAVDPWITVPKISELH